MPLDNQREDMQRENSTTWLLAEAANYTEAMIATIRWFPLCFLSQLKRQTTGRMLSANWNGWLEKQGRERGCSGILDGILCLFCQTYGGRWRQTHTLPCNFRDCSEASVQLRVHVELQHESKTLAFCVCTFCNLITKYTTKSWPDQGKSILNEEETQTRLAGWLTGRQTMFLFTNMHKRGFGVNPLRLGLILLWLSRCHSVQSWKAQAFFINGCREWRTVNTVCLCGYKGSTSEEGSSKFE